MTSNIDDQLAAVREGDISRRGFLALAGRRGLQFGLLGASLPTILAACSNDEPAGSQGDPSKDRAIVGDVLSYELSGDWEGDFGSVTFKLHRGLFEGKDVHFIRTDASDRDFASAEGLVWVPKIAALASGGPAADVFLIEGGVPEQSPVLSTEPGRGDFTPAWRVNRAVWEGEPSMLRSVKDVEDAEHRGKLRVERTSIIMNAPVVRWSGGEMSVDDERRVYLGPGQLLERPDPRTGTVTFKLHECFPGVRYIVTDTALQPMAEGMHVVHSPGLAGSTAKGATGRTNVFMNGVPGSGPMGFQPSVFDSQAGDPAWSPFWDHMTYSWKDGIDPEILRDEAAIHTARDSGQLDEFAGTPDTAGNTFVVNCPVPVLAPNTV